MIPEIGLYAIILALGLGLVQSTLPIVGARNRDPVLMGIADIAACGQFALVALAFGALIACYVRSDFSVATVFENSHSAMPLAYKISSAWGNHEGSMLLWMTILTLFGALVAAFGSNTPSTLRATVLAVQSWISVVFYLFILFTSNPFLRLPQAQAEGRDLNPILQDPGLAIHPPLLYIGYVGFSITFSFAIAALIEGRVDAAWARWVRPWILAAWTFLTLGIAMGSYWAYYTLGWGGWWYWDPVENASFMPWLAGTALLHSAVVMEKREALTVWTILLAILAFSLSLLGTFLVRSGVLTSVHAFANDPLRGEFIIAILVLLIGGALALFAWRAPLLRKGGLFAPISREGALVLNNLFLTSACATVLIGTLYPLVLETLTGAKISVGAPYFNATFAPIFLPLLVAVSFGPLLSWKRADLAAVSHRLIAAFIVGLIGILAIYVIEGKPIVAICAAGLGIFVIAGALNALVERCGLFRTPLATACRRAAGLPRSAWGTTFAHAGLGLTLLGIVGETSWGTERIASLKLKDSIEISGYTLSLANVDVRVGPNYREQIATFNVQKSGVPIGTMQPSKRAFTTRGTTTTESALMSRGLSQLYLSLGDTNAEGAMQIRLYYKPLVLLIWIGALVMALGGALSLSDRRLRIGAPKLAKSHPIMQGSK